LDLIPYYSWCYCGKRRVFVRLIGFGTAGAELIAKNMRGGAENALGNGECRYEILDGLCLVIFV